MLSLYHTVLCLFLGMVKLDYSENRQNKSTRLALESRYPRSLIPEVTFKFLRVWSSEEGNGGLRKGSEGWCLWRPWKHANSASLWWKMPTALLHRIHCSI